MTGSLPDMNLSLDFTDLVDKLRRSANTASRYGQMEELNRLGDQLVQWQIRLRRAFVLALGDTDMAVSWGTLVNQVAQVRHDKDSAEALNRWREVTDNEPS